MEKRSNGLLRVLEVSAVVFSVVCGSINLGVIIWKGGEMTHMITTHESRLAAIEARGSQAVSEHIKLDDQRESVMRERIAKLEEIYKVALDMRAEISRMSQKVDDLKERLIAKP